MADKGQDYIVHFSAVDGPRYYDAVDVRLHPDTVPDDKIYGQYPRSHPTPVVEGSQYPRSHPTPTAPFYNAHMWRMFVFSTIRSELA